MTIHDRIKRRREELQISQSELARRLGVSPQAVQQWEADDEEIRTAPRRQLRERLAKEIGVTLLWLEYGDDLPGYLFEHQAKAGVAGDVQETAPTYYGTDAVPVIANEPAEFPLSGGGIDLDRLDVRASMGTGIPLPERETVIDSIRVPQEWVREQFPHITSAKNLKIITGYGDSMKGTFNHGDPLIVDTGVNAMDVDTIYVFAYNNELYIKRIQRLPDKSVKVISDNRAMYDPFTLTPEQRADVVVIARVICAVNMNKIS